MNTGPLITIVNIEWIKADRYCEISGDTLPAIKARKARGEWLDGQHIQTRSGRLWVNLQEHAQWVRHGLKASHEA